jgi:hypothetical protein
MLTTEKRIQITKTMKTFEDDSDGEVRNVRISARARRRRQNKEAKEPNWTTELEESYEDKDNADTVAVGGNVVSSRKEKKKQGRWDRDRASFTGGGDSGGGKPYMGKD